MILEKNDVDISKLFTWGKKFDIVDSKEEAQSSVYIRLLGDADVNRARVFALRKSAELRRKLRDLDSDERLMYVREQEEMTKEELIGYIVMFSMREITNQAIRQISVPAPKQPKANAGLEKMEKYQKEIDDYPNKINAALKEFVSKEEKKIKAELANESEDALYKKYVDHLIMEFCEQEAVKAYNDMETYLGCYNDENYTERAFRDFDHFDNQPIELKQQLREAYESIRVGMDDLKKLREATQ
jgi:hypothetical protein